MTDLALAGPANAMTVVSSRITPLPPGPKGNRLIGSLIDVRGDRIRFVTRSVAAYGDVVGFRLGPRCMILLRHPDAFRRVLCDNVENYEKGIGLKDAAPLLGRGLLTSEGGLWNYRRRIVQAAFQRDRLQSYGAAIVEAIAGLTKQWDRAAREGEPVNADSSLAAVTIRIVGLTLFSTELAEIADQLAADLDIATHAAIARMAGIIPIPRWLPTAGNLRERRALRRLENRAAAICATHEAAAIDLLSALDSEPPRAVRDEMMTMLLAGRGTQSGTSRRSRSPGRTAT